MRIERAESLGDLRTTKFWRLPLRTVERGSVARTAKICQSLFYSQRIPLHNPSPFALPPASGSRHGLFGWWLVLAAVISTLWACGGATESLWVDELHSSWTVSDDFSQVAGRARAGNQSPVFFWLLYPLSQTLSKLPLFYPEWAVRFPAIACWVGLVVICLREFSALRILPAGRQHAASILLAILAWLILDRVQLFYATEARVYSSVQLVSLLAWLSLLRMNSETYRHPTNKTVNTTTMIWTWCGLSMLLVFLHMTAVLAVVCQIAWGTLVVVRHYPKQHRQWAAAVAVVALATTAALLLSARVWEHREQWSSFAGEATLKSFFALFPLVAYGVPIAVARTFDWLLSSHDSPSRDFSTSLARSSHYSPIRDFSAVPAHFNEGQRSKLFHIALSPQKELGAIQRGASANLTDLFAGGRAMWWLAALGPWLLAWWITALDVAPVFHRRFVIVSAVPLILLTAVELSHIRHLLWRWGAVIGVAVWLIVSQGTFDNWRSGNWYGWQRWEGWRQASVALNQQFQPRDELWCASGLIEANGATLPLGPELNRYLSFPLRGLYAIVDSSGQLVEPQALLTSADDWARQLLAARPAEPPTHQTLWIVYRGSPASFDERLKTLRQRVAIEKSLQWKFDPPQAYGLVSLVRIRIDTN
jgi:hypothetical protein